MLSQFVYNKMLSIPDKGLLNQIQLKMFSRMREIILKFNDSLIKCKIGNFLLFLPFSHNLPLYLKSFPDYSSNIGRIAKLIKEKYNDLSIIDIGANIGDSIAIIRTRVECPILCIEGNKHFFDILEKNSAFFSNVYIENTYVGNKAGQLKVKIQEDGGTAHLCEDKTGIIYTKTLPDILKPHPGFLKSKMIKIDTDGFDCIILRGSLDFLAMAKPVIFFEYHPYFLSKQNDDGLSIFAALGSIGYKTAIVYDNLGDYMMSIELTNSSLIEDIHNYFSGRGESRYCDICVFHVEDNDLFNKIRLLEIQFFKKRIV